MYDVIIIGGGLAGLYTAHCLPKRLRVLILEKYTLGGKVDTYKDEVMTVESGAARFSKKHVHLIKLIRALGLANKITPIPSGDPTYITPGRVPMISMKMLWDKILYGHKKKPTDITFGQYAREMLTEQEYNIFYGSYGYSAEFGIMNAADAIQAMEEYVHQFYILKGGLSQMVKKLVDSLDNTEIKKEKATNIKYLNNQFVVTTANDQQYEAPVCVMAIPATAVQKFSICRPLKDKLAYIKTSPLCRIYAQCEPGAFLEKITTNNDLRFIIPITKTVVLATYTDAKYANRWKKVQDTGGNAAVGKKLKADLDEIGIHEKLKHLKVFYWPEGVGYWGVGADSERLERELLHPFTDIPLYICGENYSHKHQQWMEGALETAKKTASSISGFFK